MNSSSTAKPSKANQMKTADEILSYLLEHPKSKDTLEGIAEWWLEMHYVDYGVDLVSKSLTQLCSKGIVKQNKRPWQYPYYEIISEPGEDPDY